MRQQSLIMPQDDLIENASVVLNRIYNKEIPMTRDSLDRALRPNEKDKPQAAEKASDVEKIHLELCPCGQRPDLLIIEMQERAKWGRAFGDCCSEWMIEFRNGYTAEPKVSQVRAAAAWNDMPRGFKA